MKRSLKLIIVDDNAPFRKGLKDYIEKVLESKVIAEASNGLEYLNLPCRFSADIILMDIEMDKMNGFDACKRAMYYNSKVRMIAVTMHMERVFLRSLVEVGFKACVFKSDVFEELPTIIDRVMEGKYAFPEEIRIV